MRPSLSFLAAALIAAPLAAQEPTSDRSNNPGPFPPRAGVTKYPAPGERGSRNMKVLSHIPLGGFLHVSDIELEQELSRPYVYIDKRFQPSGFDGILLRLSVADVVKNRNDVRADFGRSPGTLRTAASHFDPRHRPGSMHSDIAPDAELE